MMADDEFDFAFYFVCVCVSSFKDDCMWGVGCLCVGAVHC